MTDLFYGVPPEPWMRERPFRFYLFPERFDGRPIYKVTEGVLSEVPIGRIMPIRPGALSTQPGCWMALGGDGRLSDSMFSAAQNLYTCAVAAAQERERAAETAEETSVVID
jgi:hypothetical protein